MLTVSSLVSPCAAQYAFAFTPGASTSTAWPGALPPAFITTDACSDPRGTEAPPAGASGLPLRPHELAAMTSTMTSPTSAGTNG